MRFHTGSSAAIFLLLTSLVAAETRDVTLTVVDADTRQPLAARVYLQSAAGKWHYFQSAGSAVRYEKQNWINENSIEYHTTISPHPCVASLPAGKYKLTVKRGKSYFPHVLEFDVADANVQLNVDLKRWNDPAQRGWYSGDTHLHREIADLENVIIAEDLNVALPLTNWVTISDKPPAAGNKNLATIPDELVVVDQHHVIWPRSTEYEIFTVGDQQHTLGALFILGHKSGLELGVPPWRPVVESILDSDPHAVFDMDKLAWPFAMLLPTICPDAVYEISNNHTWRTEFAFRDWYTPAPNYMQSPFGATKGGHRQWLDFTMGMYYTLLNCGLRMPPSAGTANGVHPVPAGFGRVYVHLPDGFSFDAWMKGLKQGRSFVTTGPMLYASANSKDPGHVFKFADANSIQLQMEVLSEQPISYGEILVNGRPEILLRGQREKLANGAYRLNIKSNVEIKRSGWVAVRFWEPRPDGQSRFVHSAPWYVEVGQEPVRIHPEEKEYLIGRMDAEMQRSKNVVSDEAMLEYERGRAFYNALPTLDLTPAITANARELPEATKDSWLDNMIVHHRFTPTEVRLATGLSTEDAAAEVASRSSKPKASGLRILPYPGGRHPRIGFLDGAIHPQRETKISIFPPWDDGGYAVVDVPEAVFSNLGLTYLAHTHIPTIWDEPLERLEWEPHESGYRVTRELPNGIRFTSQVNPADDGAIMQISLTNGTDATLTGMRVQVCTMLKGLIGFNVQEPLDFVTKAPFVAIKSDKTGAGQLDRWLITAWQPNHRVWTNPPVPCVHSDPVFPDCEPGATVVVQGGLWFYEGNHVADKLQELRQQQ